MKHAKYPRTPHLPWSSGRSNDDIAIDSIEHFIHFDDIVVTEKLDGENTTLYHDYLHARSVDSKSHPSRDWLKQYHATVRHNIPEDFKVCGENVYAAHSIAYDALTTYFYVFVIFQEHLCLSWDETVEWAALIGLEIVPVLYRGTWDERAVKACWRERSTFGNEQEGYVVRNAGRFPFSEFRMNVAKYVRPQHVTTDQHWMYQKVTPNQLI
ncbi:2'-5' RNA ligase [candidate division KSB3 bacterium]|nr:2'-5' RNA ligase [candidate division KSB3 bacterium]